MKVCLVSTVHSPFDVRIFHKEAKTLAKAGYEVVLIAQNDKEEIVDGIKIIPLPKPGNRLERMFLLTFRCLIKALHQKADVYHLHDPELLPVGLALKLITKSKVIYDVHEDYGKQILSKSYLPEGTRGFVAIAVKIIEGVISRIFDGIVTATDDIFTNFPNHKRVVVVKNFPVLSDFTEIRKDNRPDSDTFNLIYVGGLTEIRGVTQMIQALEFINFQKGVKLTLYGKFYPPSYEEQIRSLKGFEKVEYPGWIKPQDIPEKIVHADIGIVCLHPVINYLTALPVKLFEYMACGLPVIASNFPLWKEIVEGNNCGVCVNPLNPREIAKAVEYLIDHPDEAKRMGENGRKAVEERYNWELMEERLIKLYKDLEGAKDEKNQDR
ncbi:MAG: glycosyltransferase family 4 protein [Nitrospirota bacterium]